MYRPAQNTAPNVMVFMLLLNTHEVYLYVVDKTKILPFHPNINDPSSTENCKEKTGKTQNTNLNWSFWVCYPSTSGMYHAFGFLHDFTKDDDKTGKPSKVRMKVKKSSSYFNTFLPWESHKGPSFQLAMTNHIPPSGSTFCFISLLVLLRLLKIPMLQLMP